MANCTKAGQVEVAYLFGPDDKRAKRAYPSHKPDHQCGKSASHTARTVDLGGSSAGGAAGGFGAPERVFAVALRRMMPVAGSTSYSSLAVGEKTSACMPAGSDTPAGDCTPNRCVLACHSLQQGETCAISSGRVIDREAGRCRGASTIRAVVLGAGTNQSQQEANGARTWSPLRDRRLSSSCVPP